MKIVLKVVLSRISGYYKTHRKALMGAVSTAVATYSVQVANGATVIDWRPIVVAVIAGFVGGGTVHAATNEQ